MRSRKQLGPRDLIGRFGAREFALLLSLDGGQTAEQRAGAMAMAIAPAHGLVLDGQEEPAAIRLALSAPEEGDQSVEDPFLRASETLAQAWKNPGPSIIIGGD